MVDSSIKERFNNLFDDYIDLDDQKKHISESQKDIKDEMCALLSESKTVITKVISFLKKQRDGGEDEFERIYEIISKVE